MPSPGSATIPYERSAPGGYGARPPLRSSSACSIWSTLSLRSETSLLELVDVLLGGRLVGAFVEPVSRP